MSQIVRLVTAAEDGVLIGHRVLISDLDRKWSGSVQRFGDAESAWFSTGARPERECARRAIRRSIKEECLGRIIPLGSGTSHARSRSLSSAIIANGITKDSTIG